jgi:hypothetical protein
MALWSCSSVPIEQTAIQTDVAPSAMHPGAVVAGSSTSSTVKRAVMGAMEQASCRQLKTCAKRHTDGVLGMGRWAPTSMHRVQRAGSSMQIEQTAFQADVAPNAMHQSAHAPKGKRTLPPA